MRQTFLEKRALMNQWEFCWGKQRSGENSHAVDQLPLLPLVGWMEEGAINTEVPGSCPGQPARWGQRLDRAVLRRRGEGPGTEHIRSVLKWWCPFPFHEGLGAKGASWHYGVSPSDESAVDLAYSEETTQPWSCGAEAVRVDLSLPPAWGCLEG